MFILTGTRERGNPHAGFAGSGRSAGTRNALSRLRDSATTRLRDQRGSALAAVLVLVVLLTMVGVAMVNSTFTEISVAYNAGDTAAAQYAAEAGLSPAIYELSPNAGWTCNAGASVRAIPEIDVDSAATTSLKYRAQHTNDPVDGKPVYFKGGDTTYRCNTGSPWAFTSTQQCWDYYVNSKSGTLGLGITNPVYFVEFTATESTNYTTSGGGSLAFLAGQSTNYNGLGLGNCIQVPTGIVHGHVVLAAISWSHGTSQPLTTPANYALHLTPSDLGGGTAYVLRSTNSDLSGGLDFNRELNPGTETAGSIAVSVAAGATEDSFGFTRAGQPGVSGITGNYIVEMNVTVANANILLSTAVPRVHSVGVLH